MSDRVVSFPGCVVPGKSNQELVEFLETVLEDAKAGRVVSFIGAGFMHDGSMKTLWSPGNYSIASMVGLTELLKLEYLKNCT